MLVCGFVGLSMLAVACGGSGKDKSKGASKNTSQGTAATFTTPPSTLGVKEGGTLNYVADQEPTGFNVNTRKDHAAAAINVVERIWPSAFRTGPDFKLVLDKDLMVSAEVTKVSPQTVVMKIKPEANWADGVPITADDFIYFWRTQRDPANTNDSCTNGCASNGKPIDDNSDGTGYKNISDITGTDSGKTVTVTFSKPFADWKSLWSYILPAHLAQKVGWNDGFDKFDPTVIVSGGPFRIQSYNPGKDLTLVPNDKYWGAKPHLDSLVYYFMSDAAQQVMALQNKVVDMMYPQPQLDQVNQVKQIPGVNSAISFGLHFEQLDFNVKTPGLDDLVVRKAIATAIDRPKLVERTVGRFSRKATILNNRMFVTNQPEYQDTSGGSYDKPDPAKAKMMLEADGYTLGSDGIYAKAGKRLSFRLTGAGGDALRQTEELSIQGDVRAAGVELRIDDASKLPGQRFAEHDFDIALLDRSVTPYPTGNDAFYTQCVGTVCRQNFGQVGSPELDLLLAQGAAEVDRTKEVDDYNQADTIVWDNMWTLPLFQLPTFIAVRNDFLTIHDNASSDGPFWNSETWGLVSHR